MFLWDLTPFMMLSAIIVIGIVKLSANVAINDDVKKQPLKQEKTKYFVHYFDRGNTMVYSKNSTYCRHHAGSIKKTFLEDFL